MNAEPIVIGSMGFIYLLVEPLISASSSSIWSDIPADIQGRVFSARYMITTFSFPLSTLLAGPMADTIFEPLLLEGGLCDHSSIRWITGIGRGKGIQLIFFLLGLFLITSVFWGFKSSEFLLLDRSPSSTNSNKKKLKKKARGDETKKKV